MRKVLWLLAATWLQGHLSVACCPNSCSERGRCVGGKGKFQCICVCDVGYSGVDCSERSCPLGAAWWSVAAADDQAHVPMECSNMGHCDRILGQCTCRLGFVGTACERLDCPNKCQNKGRCLTMNKLALDKDPGTGAVHTYTKNWDTHMLQGCKCDLGASGPDCLFIDCPTGDDPLTTLVTTTMCQTCAIALTGNTITVTQDLSLTGTGAQLSVGALIQVGVCTTGTAVMTVTAVTASTITVSAGHTCEEFAASDIIAYPVIEVGAAQVNEIQEISCKATGGYFVILYRQRPSAMILATDDINATTTKIAAVTGPLNTLEASTSPITVSFEQDGQATACTAGGGTIRVEFLQQFGDLALMQTMGTAKLTTSGSSAPSLAVAEHTRGTKEDELCAGRGVCDLVTGICTCGVGWDTTSNGYGGLGDKENNRGDCGHALKTIAACPGEIPCSGHGICAASPTFRCTCANEWTGSDCSLRQCKFGPSWFSEPESDDEAHRPAECSNMGVCDTTKAECQCIVGFEGGACERMACPGSPPCSGHGQCLTLQLAARHNMVNGEPSPKTYGETPNLARTWDFDSMQGCSCDAGYTGYDCSLRECPRGDDPMTENGLPEAQEIICSATTGTFTLSFRGAETASIAFTASEMTIKAELEKLPTIGTVSVFFTDKRDAVSDSDKALKDKVCTATGTNRAVVTFMTEFGDLPALSAKVSTPTSVITFGRDGAGLSVGGTKENAVCSNRGKCDTITGECLCFLGFGPSDGFGNEGMRADCGARLTFESKKKLNEAG